VTHIIEVLWADGLGSYWYDDQRAIRDGATQDGLAFVGQPVTAGFEQIRMPARSTSIGLLLSDGYVAWGDMMTVQYSGAGSREGPFDPVRIRAMLGPALATHLEACPLSTFAAACRHLAAFEHLPRSVAYGASQALLDAVAHRRGCLRVELLCDERQLPLVMEPVPLFGQSGDDRYANTDKMILKGIDVLPHGLINNREKFGPRGETFARYAQWVADRTRRLGGPAYRPVLHFDLYGTAGVEFGGDIDAIAGMLCRVEADVAPLNLRIETPFDLGSRDAQIEGFLSLRAALTRLGSRIELVADEWCDTLEDVHEFARAGAAHLVQIKMPDIGSLNDSVEAVLACAATSTRAYLGGSCAETDLSARASVHVALATRPVMLLAKPGMGVDEALAIVGNEQSRALSLLRARNPPKTRAGR